MPAVSTVNQLAAELNRSAVTRIAGVHDGSGAGLAEAAGIDALWLSGLCLSTALGVPDGENVSADELLRAAESVRGASRLPVIVDANAGFGGPAQVARLAGRLARLGIDGMSIEDKAFPRKNSLLKDSGFELMPAGAFAAKVAAARDASGGSLLTVARTESLVVGETVEQALERARLYVAAGAEVIIAHGKVAAPVLEFARSWTDPTPLMVIPTAMPELSIVDIEAAGIAGVIYANQAFRAALHAMRDAFRELARIDRLNDCRSPMLGMDELFVMQGLDQEEESLKRYQRAAGAAARLVTEQRSVRAVAS